MTGKSFDFDVDEEIMLRVLEIYCFSLLQVSCIEHAWKLYYFESLGVEQILAKRDQDNYSKLIL